MASNFRILIDRGDQDIQLKLSGDFDGSSACELLNALKEKCSCTNPVVIDTNGLKEIYPFGRETFRRNLYRLKPRPVRFSVTGRHADQITPRN